MSGPTYPPVPDVARFDIRQKLVTQPRDQLVQMSFYVRDEANDWDVTHQSDVRDDILDWYTANLKPLQPNDCFLLEIRSKDLSAVSNPTFFTSVGTGIPGTHGSVSSPGSVSATIGLIAESGSTPPRSYVRCPGVPESITIVNALNGTDRTAYDTAFTALRTALNTGTQAMSVVSVYEPAASGGGTPATLFRDTGLRFNVASILTATRVGRCVSRLKGA